MLAESLQKTSIIVHCSNPPPEDVVSHHGKRVIRISDHQVVKCGPDETEAEANNQRIAYDLVDSRVARIPRVYDFFSDEEGDGYIVMEFIEGKMVDPLDASAIEKSQKCLITSPLCQALCLELSVEGLAMGCSSLTRQIWSSTPLTRWRSGGMARILPDEPKLTFQGFDLVFCHLDMAPRNILWLEDGSICIVDWNSAGY